MAKTTQDSPAYSDALGGVTWDWMTMNPSTGTVQITPDTWSVNPPTPYTYVPPEEFQRQVVELIQLLHVYGPKLKLLADVLGAMKIEEEDNAK